MSVEAKQPVLILGGFLITQEAYQPMATTLQELTGAEVAIVPMSRLDWLMTSGPEGWIRCLDRVDAMVRALQARSATGKVTLIGHSSGGVMLRPYLLLPMDASWGVLSKLVIGLFRCKEDRFFSSTVIAAWMPAID